MIKMVSALWRYLVYLRHRMIFFYVVEPFRILYCMSTVILVVKNKSDCITISDLTMKVLPLRLTWIKKHRIQLLARLSVIRAV